ncbi:MAG: putative glycoside hydrolase [Anaerolineales bacterium]
MLALFLILLPAFAACTAGPAASVPAATATAAPPAADPSAALPFPIPSFDLDYPRLITFTPWGNPIEDIARFDAVMGSWPYPGAVEEVRAANPAAMVFDYFNPVDVGCNPDHAAGEGDNRLIGSLPPEWFLTQAGSTLAEAVDSSADTFAVAEVAAAANGEAIDLFLPGDALLIEGESMLVLAVDEDARRLTVRRGYCRPASPHPAGARIAAHISVWPGQWQLDLSTAAAAGDSSPLGGWAADFQARRAAEIIRTGGWDGLFLDCMSSDIGGLIWQPNIRSIDIDRSNRIPAEYGPVERAYSVGLRRFERVLRREIGREKILFANGDRTNFDMLNGVHFESFPSSAVGTGGGTPAWETMVFGPRHDGGYLEWSAYAARPRFTVLQTFQNETSPNATSDIDKLRNAADCRDADFEPDYRRMRFGLATTLLGDGFFSFEYSTYASSWMCLFWFDEYDNAGAGKGYLGRPLGPPYRAVPSLAVPNLLGDGSFDRSLDGWTTWANEPEGCSLSISRDAGSPAEEGATVRVETAGCGSSYHSVLGPPQRFALTAGKPYTLSFWARADRLITIDAVLQKSADPWTLYGSFGRIDLTPFWRHYRVSAVSSAADPAAGLSFLMGAESGTVWFDGVTLQEGSDQVWRRDFEGGIVLVNPTAEPRTVSLGGQFRKIRGTQDPAVNDGSVVSEVTLPARDGLILLRMDDPDNETC